MRKKSYAEKSHILINLSWFDYFDFKILPVFMEPLRHNALKLIGNDRHADERRKTQKTCLNIFNIWDSVECCAYDEI